MSDWSPLAPKPPPATTQPPTRRQRLANAIAAPSFLGDATPAQWRSNITDIACLLLDRIEALEAKLALYEGDGR